MTTHDDARPCGCPEDYHLADCPLRASAQPMSRDEWDPYGDEDGYL